MSKQTDYICFTQCLLILKLFSFQIDLVIGEPVFQTSSLPWDNMCFWYQAQQLRNHFKEQTRILPGKMTIYAIPVYYKDLWKIRADVGLCEGFNLQEFDKVIQVLYADCCCCC